VRLVLAAHVPEPIEGAGVLAETAAALRCALAADVPARPAHDVLGLAMREVAAGGVTVTLPPEGGRAGAGDG
jgi:hypothetical protein